VFGRQDYATRLVAALHAASLPATAHPRTLNGRAVTRVVVGPFETVADRRAALRTVRSLGAADAFPTSE